MDRAAKGYREGWPRGSIDDNEGWSTYQMFLARFVFLLDFICAGYGLLLTGTHTVV